MQRVQRWVKKNYSMGDLMTFGLFVIFATIIWFGHALNVVRERAVSIEVHYIGVEDNICFSSPLPEQLQVTVRDQGKRLQSYDKSYFAPITIDLSSQLQDREGQVVITSEQIRPKITDQLQGTAKLQKVVPEYVSLDYYRQAEKSVPVVFAGEVTPQKQYQLVGKVRLIPNTIKVFGKQEQLDSISQVLTEPLTINNAKDTIEREARLQPIAGLRLERQQVSIVAITEQFTERQFTLPIETLNVPEKESLRLFPNQVKVTLRLGINHFNDITDSDLHAVCYYPKRETTLLPIEVRCTLPFVNNIRVQPQEVEYIIEKR